MIRKPRKTRLTPEDPPVVKKEVVEEISADDRTPEEADRDTRIQAFALELMRKRSEAIKARGGKSSS